MIISITGKPGSGKSTVGKIIAEKLGYKHISMGDIRGEMAKSKGLTIDELNKIGETEDWTDKEPDKRQEDLGKTEDNFVIDGWVSFHFIPHSFKVFIDCDYDAAAARIFKHQRPDEEHQKTVEGVKEMIQSRWEESRQRYLKWYSLDINKKEPFDLVLDSTHKDQDEIAEEILKKIAGK